MQQQNTNPGQGRIDQDRLSPSGAGFLCVFLKAAWLAMVFFEGIDLFALDPERAVTQYVTRTYRVEDGLPQMSVSVVLQAQDRYLWIGTQSGLSRFDGIKFKNFSPANLPLLQNGYIQTMAQAEDGTLWIGTRGSGLLAYSKGGFTSLTIQDGLLSNHVISLALDNEGQLWVGTDQGLQVISTDLVPGKAWAKQDGLPGNRVKSLVMDAENRLWVGTDRGLCIMHDQQFSQFRDQAGMAENEILAIYREPDDSIWVSVANYGLVVYHRFRFEHYPYPEEQKDFNIMAMCRDRAGNFWVGGTGNGLIKLEGKNFKFTTGPNPIDSNINSIVEDLESNLWVATETGLFQLRDGASYHFGTSEGLAANLVWSVYQDSEDDLWIGTDQGLNHLREDGVDTYTTRNGLPSDSIRTILPGEDGHLWLGTQDGLSLFKDRVVANYDTSNGLPDNNIRSLMTDDQGSLWVGTQGGLAVKNGEQFTVYTTEDGLSSNLVRVVYQDRLNRIWVGTDAGLNLWQGGSFQTFTTADGLPNDFITAIRMDADNNLWVCTFGGGLLHYRDGRFQSLGMSEGLPSNELVHMFEDETGGIWLLTLQDPFYVSRQEVMDYFEGKRNSIVVELLGKEPGFDNEYNKYGSPSMFVDAQGRFLIPSHLGLVVINPREARKKKVPPPVHLEQILVDGKQVPQEALSELPADTSRITFQFSAIQFAIPEQMEYWVKLEGFDPNWESVGSNREKQYTNLPSKEYTFSVKAFAGEGTLSANEVKVRFYIKPHFYQTWYFYLIVGIGFLGGTHALGRWRIRKMQARQEALEALVTARTEALAQANEELKTAQENLVQTAHLAGKAEIAKEVLHNVGNVLNSVNVSVTLIVDLAEKIKSEQIGKMTDLLRDHVDELPGFLKDDERGRKLLPAYYALGRNMEKNKKAILEETDFLNEKLWEIKKTVLAQTDHVDSPAMYEKVRLKPLLDEVLMTQRPHFDANNVALELDLAVNPELQVIKSKIRQVFMVLIRNAWEAAAGINDQKEKRVVIRAIQEDPEWVHLEVADNGVGIAEENLTRVFNHGFSTKVGGNGFGLHFCGNTMMEMKGHISVKSAGKGKGATFFLNIPVVTPRES